MSERNKEQMNGLINELKGGYANERASEWTSEQRNEQVNEWTNERTKVVFFVWNSTPIKRDLNFVGFTNFYQINQNLKFRGVI